MNEKTSFVWKSDKCSYKGCNKKAKVGISGIFNGRLEVYALCLFHFKLEVIRGEIRGHDCGNCDSCGKCDIQKVIYSRKTRKKQMKLWKSKFNMYDASELQLTTDKEEGLDKC